MKLKQLNVIITVICVIATLGIEYLLRPEQIGSLYKFNMAAIILLEVLFINALYLTAKKENYSPQSITVAVRVLKYGVFAALWLVIYAVALRKNVDIKWYYVVHIALLAWFAISAFVLNSAGAKQIEVNEAQQARVEERAKTTAKVFVSKSDIERNITKSSLSVEAKRDINLQVNTIYDKLRFSPANLGEDDLAQSYLEQINTLSSDNDSSEEAIKEKIADLISYINSRN
ncbi:MAG: hypothetical protein R3Y38_07540 [Rikenellaceae bacterium]